MKKIHTFLFLGQFIFSLLFSGIDLEVLSQPFVLSTKQLHIPGFPNAFNPSIVRWRGRILLSFRNIPDPKQKYNSDIGVVFLDENLNPIGNPQILKMRAHGSKNPCRAEDGRLIVVSDQLYLVYDDNPDIILSKGGFRVYLAHLVEDESGNIVIESNLRLSPFPGESTQKREKSWVPFEYEDQLLLAYSLSPHVIFAPDLQSGACTEVVRSSQKIDWGFGELRGGTQASIEGGSYLAFFHSSLPMSTIHSNDKTIAHYFIGAYTYEAEPPFKIKTISCEPIVGRGFYSGKVYPPYWAENCALFPCGYITEGPFIWLAYGRQDHEAWIVQIDKEALFHSLRPVSSNGDPL